MLESLITAVLGIVFVMFIWIIVQSLWRKSFSEYLEDEDVLAHRTSCGNCGCTKICSRKGYRLEPPKDI